MKLLHPIIVFAITSVYSIDAHVQLLSPPSIINSDYQYTFEPGTCAKGTCDAFCGESDINPTITSIESANDRSINVKLLISVRHNPYRYRISVYDGDIETIQGFDTNVLLDNIEIDGAKEGWVSVSIPQGMKCDPYCVLQLFDYYYFVSCALFTLDGAAEETNLGSETTMDTSVLDTKPIISQEEIVFQNTPAVRIKMTASLDYITYLALGISSQGAMVGSMAVVGSVEESHDDNGELIAEAAIYTTTEYSLGGKFSELVTPTLENEKLAFMSNFTIDYWDGLYKHTLEVIIRKEDTCGKKIIWSYSSPVSPSTVLAYHGVETRGVYSLPIMCEEELELESSVDRSDLNGESGTSISVSSSGNSRGSKYDMLSVVLPAVLFIALFVQH